jgi:hypothetical protein
MALYKSYKVVFESACFPRLYRSSCHAVYGRNGNVQTSQFPSAFKVIMTCGEPPPHFISVGNTEEHKRGRWRGGRPAKSDVQRMGRRSLVIPQSCETARVKRWSPRSAPKTTPLSEFIEECLGEAWTANYCKPPCTTASKDWKGKDIDARGDCKRN